MWAPTGDRLCHWSPDCERRSRNLFAAHSSTTEAIPPCPYRSILPPAIPFQLYSPSHIPPVETTIDSQAAPTASPVGRINFSLRSVPLPFPPPVLDTAPVVEVWHTTLLPLSDLVSWSGRCVVLGDLPIDSLSSLVALFGRLAVELIKSVALEASFFTLQSRLAALETDYFACHE